MLISSANRLSISWSRREVRETFVSKKHWRELEKRIADLEKRVQDQPLEKIAAELTIKINKAIDSISHTLQE